MRQNLVRGSQPPPYFFSSHLTLEKGGKLHENRSCRQRKLKKGERANCWRCGPFIAGCVGRGGRGKPFLHPFFGHKREREKDEDSSSPFLLKPRSFLSLSLPCLFPRFHLTCTTNACRWPSLSWSGLASLPWPASQVLLPKAKERNE